MNPTRAVRDVVYARAGYRCERCGGNGPEFSVHHRLPRKSGGTRNPAINDLANLCLLCNGCHRHVESFRTEAYAQGWLVHSWQDPAAVPRPQRSET